MQNSLDVVNKLDNLGCRIDSKVDDFAKRFDGKIDTLQTTMSDVRIEMAKVSTSVSAHTDSIDHLQNNCERLWQRVDERPVFISDAIRQHKEDCVAAMKSKSESSQIVIIPKSKDSNPPNRHSWRSAIPPWGWFLLKLAIPLIASFLAGAGITVSFGRPAAKLKAAEVAAPTATKK